MGHSPYDRPEPEYDKWQNHPGAPDAAPSDWLVPDGASGADGGGFTRLADGQVNNGQVNNGRQSPLEQLPAGASTDCDPLVNQGGPQNHRDGMGDGPWNGKTEKKEPKTSVLGKDGRPKWQRGTRYSPGRSY